ncbi:MAG: PAS domain S-box protein, partial [Deltaproteobacteria bacterium]|nr:PAS domain S-box protein [Deltaproteobacteria bacterium]
DGEKVRVGWLAPYDLSQPVKSNVEFYLPLNGDDGFFGARLALLISDEDIAVTRNVTKRNKTKEQLRENEEKFRVLVEGFNAAIFRLAIPSGVYEYMSPLAESVFGYSAESFINKPFLIKEIVHPDFRDYSEHEFANLAKNRVSPVYEYKIIDSQGNERWILQSNKGVFDKQGNILAIEGLCVNITKRKLAEQSLCEKKRELINQAKRLDEVNTALKVLLAHREQEKLDQEKDILATFTRLVFPSLDKLKESQVSDYQQAHLAIIESNLVSICSPFAARLSSPDVNLTPAELQVADMIRQGKSSKEIAKLLYLSINTIRFHRQGIRVKLGIARKKVNLRSYLQSLAMSTPESATLASAV